MSIRFRIFAPIALAVSTLAFNVLPASAYSLRCFCLYAADGPADYCKKGEVIKDENALDPSEEVNCAQVCAASTSNTGSTDFYLLSNNPPNQYFANKFGNHLCFKDFKPPAGYTGSCMTSATAGCGTQVNTPCNVTIKTDAPNPLDLNEFRTSTARCAANCAATGQFVCHGPVFTPVGQAAAAPPPDPTTGQGATFNGQILSGSVLTLPLPLGDISLPNLIGRVIQQVLSIVGALALLFFVWGGLQIMLGSGFSGAGTDPKKIEAGKKTVIAALSGLVAIFVSYAILDFLIKAISK